MEDLKQELSQNNLSEAECAAILQVLNRDEQLRAAEEKRIISLRTQVQKLRRQGAIHPGQDPNSSCARCLIHLGLFINSGALCPVCQKKVCKSCRHYCDADDRIWTCILCHKQMELKAASGEWMESFACDRTPTIDPKRFKESVRYVVKEAAQIHQGNIQHGRVPVCAPLQTTVNGTHVSRTRSDFPNGPPRSAQPLPVHIVRRTHLHAKQSPLVREIVNEAEGTRLVIQKVRTKCDTSSSSSFSRSPSSSSLSSCGRSPVVTRSPPAVSENTIVMAQNLHNVKTADIVVEPVVTRTIREVEVQPVRIPELPKSVPVSEPVAKKSNSERPESIKSETNNVHKPESNHVPVHNEVRGTVGIPLDIVPDPDTVSLLFQKVGVRRQESEDCQAQPEEDDHTMVHRSSPRGRLRARGKSLSGSGDDLKGSTGSMPQIFVSTDCVDNSASSRDSVSLSEKDSICVSEEDIDQAFNSHSKPKTSLFGMRSESLSSVYSAAGGGRYGAVTVTGEILFGIHYNYKESYLNLHIKECRNLAAVDSKRNRSDPYVKVYLLPDKTKSGKRKTKVKKHCLNPVFDEVLKFHVTSGELETRTMWISVWHSDIFGRNDFLGEVMLPLSTEFLDNSALKWYPLQERLDTLESPLCYKGDIILALKYVPPDVTHQKPYKKISSLTKGSLHILVKQARNLMATRSNGTSDPFCKSYLLPDKSKSGKQKTQVIKKSCNPKWNHTFVYEDLTVQDLHERCLELTIWDYDKITSNDFLGGIRLSLGAGKCNGRDVDWMDSVGEEVVLWRSMLDQPNLWIEGSLLLRPTISRRS